MVRSMWTWSPRAPTARRSGTFYSKDIRNCLPTVKPVTYWRTKTIWTPLPRGDEKAIGNRLHRHKPGIPWPWSAPGSSWNGWITVSSHKLFEFQQQLLRETCFPHITSGFLDRRRTSPPIISGLVSTSRNTIPLSAYKKAGCSKYLPNIIIINYNQSNTKILKGLAVSRCWFLSILDMNKNSSHGRTKRPKAMETGQKGQIFREAWHPTSLSMVSCGPLVVHRQWSRRTSMACLAHAGLGNRADFPVPECLRRQ